MKQITPTINRPDDTQQLVAQLIRALGSDPTDEGLVETPQRFLRFVQEFTDRQPVKYSTFPAENYSEMIIQKNIRFYSLCEHHLMPFFGTATVAYIPRDRLLGLSKLARTVEAYSRRLQNQERLTHQIAQQLMTVLSPKGVGVIISARHMCMEMRGVRQPETQTTTSALTGLFRTGPTRQEFINLA